MLSYAYPVLPLPILCSWNERGAMSKPDTEPNPPPKSWQAPTELDPVGYLNERTRDSPAPRIWLWLAGALLVLILLILWQLQSHTVSSDGMGVAFQLQDLIKPSDQSVDLVHGVVMDHADANDPTGLLQTQGLHGAPGIEIAPTNSHPLAVQGSRYLARVSSFSHERDGWHPNPGVGTLRPDDPHSALLAQVIQDPTRQRLFMGRNQPKGLVQHVS